MADSSRYGQTTSVNDLLSDDYFIVSTFQPTQESRIFWESLIRKGILAENTLCEAQRCIKQNTVSMPPDLPVTIWTRISETNVQNRHKKKRLYQYTSAAALLVMAFGLSFWYVKEDREQSLENIMPHSEAIKMGNQIQLITEDTQIGIPGGEAKLDYSADGAIRVNDNYIEKDLDEGKLVYNTLIVPYGKRTLITLSDQSTLWVNAGTTVRYPVEFVGENRTIYVNGEVYGDIHPDAQRPFIFKTDKFDVQVLGTTLNVSAYPNKDLQSVVLVSGAVIVKPKEGKEQRLRPAQGYFLEQGLGQLRHINPASYTSWVDGYYTFSNQALEIITAHISDFYGVEIQLKDTVKKTWCSGSLDLKDDAEKVMTGLCNMLDLQWKYVNNKYIVSNKSERPMK